MTTQIKEKGDWSGLNFHNGLRTVGSDELRFEQLSLREAQWHESSRLQYSQSVKKRSVVLCITRGKSRCRFSEELLGEDRGTRSTGERIRKPAALRTTATAANR